MTDTKDVRPGCMAILAALALCVLLGLIVNEIREHRARLDRIEKSLAPVEQKEPLNPSSNRPQS